MTCHIPFQKLKGVSSLALLFLALMNFSLLSYSQNRTFEVNGINYRIVKEPVGAITNGTVHVCALEFGEYEGEIVIPNIVKETAEEFADQYKVVGIDEGTFAQTKHLTSVKLPPSIEMVGEDAFRFSSVETIVLPMGNLTVIGRNVFYGSHLKSIEIPSTVKEIGENAFCNCFSLSELTLHEGLTTIGDYAFYQCTELKAIQFPNSLKSIGEYSFKKCYQLSDVIFGTGLKVIETGAFSECMRLRSVNLPNSLRDMGDYSFLLSGIVEISIPESIKVIKKGCFARSMLRHVILPNGLREVEDYAFAFCLIDTIIVPASAKIDFTTNITLTKSKGNSNETFHVPQKDSELIQKLSELKSRINEFQILKVRLSDVDFYVGDYGGEMTIDGIKYKPISYPIGEEEYGTLVVSHSKSAFGDIIIPGIIEIVDGPYSEKYLVAGIEDGAFDGNKNVTSLHLPASVLTFGIGMSAFRGTGITDFRLPENMEEIPSGLFKSSGITSVSLPKQLKKIGSWAFSETELTEIVIPEGVIEINNSAFKGCKQLTRVVLPLSLHFLGENVFNGCPIEQIILPDSLAEIGSQCFYNTKIEKITIPEGVLKIGKAAFDNKNLLYVNICGDPCTWTNETNYIFGSNPQLKIVIPKIEYAKCKALQWYDSEIVVKKK